MLCTISKVVYFLYLQYTYCMHTDLVLFYSYQRFIGLTEEELYQRRADQSANTRGIAFLEALLLDCKESTDPNLGQIMKSIQPAFFTKWGKHYLYSVLSAFEKRVCINFKDKAMQIYKSEAFKLEQGRVEELFLQLPPPKPSLLPQQQHHQQYGGYHNQATPPGSARGGRGGHGNAPVPSAAPAASRVRMTTYFASGGGCFTGDSLVFAKDAKEAVQVQSVKRGDEIWSNLGLTEVECIVQLKYSGLLYRGKF